MPCFQLRLKKIVWYWQGCKFLPMTLKKRNEYFCFGTGRFYFTKSLRNPGCQWSYRLQNVASGNSLTIQLSGFHTSTAGGIGSSPGQGNKIPHAVWHGQKIKINCFTKMWLTSEINLSLHWRLGERDHRGRTEGFDGLVHVSGQYHFQPHSTDRTP